MAVLVVAEHDNASVKDATNKVVTAAKAMGADVDVLVAGSNAGGAAAAAAKIEGVRKVLHADGATLAKQLAEPMDALITPLAANYDAILFPAYLAVTLWTWLRARPGNRRTHAVLLARITVGIVLLIVASGYLVNASYRMLLRILP